MDTQQPPRRLPKIKFRVLIIGRANAGKTSILQRVCDTTESPVVYRRNGSNEERIQLDPSRERGEHRIEDEIVFSNHDGYIFHDSRGFESGSADELKIVQNFVQQKSGEKRLASRLHAIWYCIPMDDVRPELDLKHFKDICPDPNVPVIGVFTKYDQFKLDVEMDMEDGGIDGLETPEARFEKYYLCHLGGARFVQLERMHQADGCCKNLIEETANALEDDVVALMLVAVQRSNLEVSVMLAVKGTLPLFGPDAKQIVKNCLKPFPYIWWWRLLDDDRLLDLLDLDEDDDDDDDDDDRLLLDDDEDDLLDDDEDDDDDDDDWRWRDWRWRFLLNDLEDDFLTFIMSMSIIKQLSSSYSGYHFMTAIIIILKHATTLRLSGLSGKPALAQAELDYQKLNIGSKIAPHFTAPPQEYSVSNFVDFIMGVSF